MTIGKNVDILVGNQMIRKLCVNYFQQCKRIPHVFSLFPVVTQYLQGSFARLCCRTSLSWKRLPDFIQETKSVWTTSMIWTNSGKIFQCLKYKDGPDTSYTSRPTMYVLRRVFTLQRRTKRRTCLIGIIRLDVLRRHMLRNVLRNGYSTCANINLQAENT